MDTKALKNIFDKFSSFNILVIGDVMVDSYLWGKVERISPEAPVPVVSVIRKEDRLGGAANVALNLSSLGAKTVICSVIGNDSYGKAFLEICKSNKINTEGIVTSAKRKTTVKTRVIGGNQHLLRVDEEETTPVTGAENTKLTATITELLNKNTFHSIIFEDYDKGVINGQLIKSITGIAKKIGIRVDVDPKKRNFHEYSNVSLFKPNLRELNEGMKTDIRKDNITELFKLCKVYQINKSISEMMVTLSERGIFICNKETYYHIPTHVRDVADVSGAGDTVIAVASLCRAAGLDIGATAVFSNLAGGLVCEKPGVVPVDKNDLYKACRNYFGEKS